MLSSLPMIDIAPLFEREEAARLATARAIAAACRESGFFYATGHGIARRTLRDL